MTELTIKRRQREVVTNTEFTWNPQLKDGERKRYEEVRAAKTFANEPRRDPEEVRENFIRGYTENLNATKH